LRRRSADDLDSGQRLKNLAQLAIKLDAGLLLRSQ
jgi:hypothetical protein